jgi:hypothetical protein
MARPFENRLPIFPYPAAGQWSDNRTLWTGVLVATSVWLVATLRA